MFGFLGWLLQVLGQSSVFVYGLAIAHLYIQSFILVKYVSKILNSKVLQIKGVCAGSWFVFLVKMTIDETTYLFKIFFLQFISITNHLLMAIISLFWFWERHPLKPYNGCEFPKIYRTFDTCGLRTLGHSLLFL